MSYWDVATFLICGSEQIVALQAESETAQKKNIELAAAVDSAAETVKDSTDTIAVTHASEIQSLHHKFGAKENKLLEKIGGFEKIIETLKSEHAGEVTKLTKQVEEVNVIGNYIGSSLTHI